VAKRRKPHKKPSALYQQYKRKKQLKAQKRKPATFSFKDVRGKDRRDHLGRFISDEDWQYRRKEISQRKRDYERAKKDELARVLRERAEAKRKREALIKKRRREWERGARTKTGKLRKLYTDKSAGERRSAVDGASVSAGELPEAHKERQIGSYSALQWVWFGDSALATAEGFLIEARSQMPPNTLGSIRIGTSYDKKRGRWVSTPVLPLKAEMAHGRDLLSALFRLQASESGQNVFGEEGEVDVWVELELLVK
jgi:hypothetical protein